MMRLPHLARDKADTLLLLVAALLVMAPHAGHLPLWISLLCAVTLTWRGLITWRGLRMPSHVLLLSLAAVSMIGVFSHFRAVLGRDSGVAMLVLLVTFKMLEMRAKRDLFVVIFLCYFLVLTNFFYSQSIFTGLLMAMSIVALLAAQMTFQFTGAVPPLMQRLRKSGTIFLIAAPLAVVLFILFPRIHGPLWGMPGDSSARSGLSDSMAPGSVSNLAMSDEPAFRVKFDGAIPRQDQLYWRGIVLSTFDGRSWTGLKYARSGLAGTSAPRIHVSGKPVQYQVTLEPTNSRWLFALEVPEALPTLPRNPSYVSHELELFTAYKIGTRVRYSAASYLDYTLGAEQAAPEMAQWLQLPPGYNPLATEFAGKLKGSPAQRVAAVLNYFGTRGYRYTLQPPLLGTDSIDEFLFISRAGFCEHYAGAFVMLMRASGIPARVVTGYQGGEFNPVDGYVQVRQSDAHAWAEVWLEGRGWRRVDPTAYVAPDRINRNLASVVPPRPPFGIEGLAPLSGLGLANVQWLNQLRFQLAALNNGWNQWVLNYTPERQRDTVSAIKASLSDGRMLASIAAVLLLAGLARAWRLRSQIDRIDALYFALCRQLARRGLARAPSEGPNAYGARLQAASLEPAKRAAALRFLALYSEHKYGVPKTEAGLAATLQRLLNESQ
jgi:transglutaminase-like putative cysteine protease